MDMLPAQPMGQARIQASTMLDAATAPRANETGTSKEMRTANEAEGGTTPNTTHGSERAADDAKLEVHQSEREQMLDKDRADDGKGGVIDITV